MKYIPILLATMILFFLGFSAKTQTKAVFQTPSPFSPYRISNGLIFVSGQIGISPQTNKILSGNFTSEAKQTLENVKVVLNQAGLNLSDVVNATICLTSMDNYAEFNAIYNSCFTAPFPARVCIAVKELPGK